MPATTHDTEEDRDAAATTAERSARKLLGLLDCPICRAPNGGHRAGCFNCGSLLQPSGDAWEGPLVRIVVGEAERPGRVLYVRR
jgi:hypothetical protein